MIGEVGGGGRFFSPRLAIFTAKARAAEDRDVLGIALALLSIANARPSLRDSGTIPVQCHVALRGTGGIFAHPSGEEGEPANRKQDNTRPMLCSSHVVEYHAALVIPNHTALVC